MILSRTSQYALQALVFLAMQPVGKPILNREIANQLGVPTAYLAKIMQDLAKAKLVRSFRGQRGGFCLKDGAERVSLGEIISLTEGREFAYSCMLGMKDCAGDTPCPVHCEWVPIRQAILKLLGESRLNLLAAGVRSGRCRLADVHLAAIPGEHHPQ
jgi:Rrf2 family protein